MDNSISSESVPAVPSDPRSPWPRAEARLRELWQTELTARQIAERLCEEFPEHAFTKCSVIGKAHRLGLDYRKPPVAEMPRPAEVAKKRFGDESRCRWPIGHPNEPNFCFCGGKRAAGKPYCAEHAARAYLPPIRRSVATADIAIRIGRA
jgi:GcrA cell cycle regulator